MLITFEGIDFSGKSTQVKLLAQRLREDGVEPIVLREPGGTAISEKVRAILLDGQNDAMSLKAELLLFSAARTQLVTEVIKPALQRGTIVICDRFYDSTTAYQGYGRGIALREIEQINAIATDGTRPDLTLFIHIGIDELAGRSARAGIPADRMESSGKQFYQRVIDGYLAIAQQEPDRFRIIDGTLLVDQIHTMIYAELSPKLGQDKKE